MAALGERKRPILKPQEEPSYAEDARSEDRRAEQARDNVLRDENIRRDEARRPHDGHTAEPRHESRPMNGEEKPSPLLEDNEENEFRSRWQHIQASFVDEPRRAVEQADELVAETMQRLAQRFAEQKKNLETQWEHSEKVSTEDLRMAFRRYRSFFDRLLSL
jgi:hypothetical protein